MEFNPNNNVVKLCAQGMEMEGKGKPGEAGSLFLQAWNEASNDFEKFTTAHYVARHQKSAADKLKWDETALQFALKLNNHLLRRWVESIGRSPLYVSGGGENKSKFRVWLSSFLSSPS